MGVTFTIAGTDRRANVVHGSLRITKDDEVEQCRFQTRDPLLTAGAYRPALGDVVRVTQDGELLFGGTIEDISDAAADGFLAGSTRVDVRAVGYHLQPSQVTVRKTYAAGLTTLAVYADLFAVLTGVTYIGASSGGPTLPALAFDRCALSTALDQVKRISGYPWRINGDLQAWAGAAGAVSGPTFSDSNATVLRRFSWERARTLRATRVWTKVGTAVGATARMQTWTGNGTQTRFYTDVEPTVTPTLVTEDGTPYAVPSATWTWDSVRSCFTRSSALGTGVSLVATYTIEYPAYCRAQNQAAVDGGDLAELIYAYPDVLDLDQGVALAAGHLAQQTITPKTVRLATRAVNVYPWMDCSLSFSARLISGDYLVRSVQIEPFGTDWAADAAMLSTVSLVEGSNLTATWLDFWRDKLGAASGGASVSTAGGGVSIITINGVLEGDLGGSRSEAIQHSTWVEPREYRDWRCPADGTYVAHVEVWTRNAATSVQPRVYDVTASSVANTGTASTSTTPAKQQITFAALAGHEYRLQVLPGNTTYAVYGLGKVRT